MPGASSTWEEWKDSILYSGNALYQLIFSIVAVFLVFRVFQVIFSLFLVDSDLFMTIRSYLSVSNEPMEILTQPWSLVTYMFLHADIYHILFNLFALWIFGQAIENLWGSKRFLLYYMLCGVGAAVIHMFVGGYFTYTLGASGAVFGILLAFGMMFPDRYIMLLIPPIPVKAKYFVLFYGLFELFNGLSMPNSGVAHFAHLGGLAVGFVLIKYWGLKKPEYYG
jgi:membrane associated rhomboid family serine protease